MKSFTSLSKENMHTKGCRKLVPINFPCSQKFSQPVDLKRTELQMQEYVEDLSAEDAEGYSIENEFRIIIAKRSFVCD